MKRHIKIYALAALVSVCAPALTSCEDFLVADNKSEGGKTADDYYNTAEGLAAFRTYAFSLAKPLVDETYICMTDDGTDLYWNARGKSSTDADFGTYTLVAENSTCKDFYSACYKLINACNGVINYGGDTYGSEMKFLRSYAYYLLSQQFGGVPYVTTYINSAETSYPKTQLKDLYDGILADLDAVVADESVPEMSTHDGSVSKQAANALAAKVALAAGWDLGTTLTDDKAGTYTIGDKTYFNRAASYADKAIAGVSLISDFAEKWDFDNEDNQEEIFSIDYDRASYAGAASECGHSLQNQFANYYGEMNVDGCKQGSSCNGTSLKSLYLFEEGDARYAATFAVTHYNYASNWDNSGYYAKYKVSNTENLPIAYYYAPSYTSKSDFLAYLNDHQAQFIKGDCTTQPKAVLLGKTSTVATFNADGTYTTQDYTFVSGTTPGTNGSDFANLVAAMDCVSKWDDPNTLQAAKKTQSCRDILILDVAGAKLDKAEALLMAGDEAGSLATLNEIRERANAGSLSSFGSYSPTYASQISGFTPTSIDVVLDERARETYGQPGRWYDLRRTRQLFRYVFAFGCNMTYSTQIPTPTGVYKWYRPIPFEEISGNTGMTQDDQNPGY